MAKRKKRMSKEELQAPDEIEVALRKFWEGMAKKKNLIIGVVAALLLVGVGLWVMGALSASSANARAEKLEVAAAPIGAPVGEPDEREQLRIGPRPERFADRAAALTAAHERLSGYLAEDAGDDKVLVQLALANVKLQQKDVAGALKDAEAWLASNGDSPLVAAGLDLKARALAASGEHAKASAVYREIAAKATGQLKAQSLVRAGDLMNPLVITGGDAAKARAAYEEALTALGPKPASANPFQRVSPGLRGAVENKLALLPK